MTVLELAAQAASNIDARAKKIKARTVALYAVAAIPFIVGFTLYFTWRALWLVVSWIFAAGAEGFEAAKQAGGKKGGPWAT